MLEPTKVPTIEPEKIPTTEPEHNMKETPYRPDLTGWKSKPIWKSKTILSIVAAVVALALGALGIEGVDVAAIAEDNMVTLGEIVTFVFVVLAAIFRIKATGPLETPGSKTSKG